MKIKFITFFVFLIVSVSFSQQAGGVIVDENNVPVQNVNVYLDGTTFVSQTDTNGNFALNFNIMSNRMLVISCIGYHTQYLSDYNNRQDLRIQLKKAVIELNEVNISFDGFSRKQKLKLFRSEFLGRTANGRNCLIENEDQIYFAYNRALRKLQVFANAPLIVVNKNLGYRIFIDLIGFEATFYRNNINPAEMYRCTYSVLSHFEETSTAEKFLKRRLKTYSGSQLQFFRNMVNHVWNKNNFMLFFGDYPAKSDDFFDVASDNNLSTVVIKNQPTSFRKKIIASFDVLFNNKKQSIINFEIPLFTIDHFGNNSHIENIVFSGHLAEQKVGGMLPMNFGLQ